MFNFATESYKYDGSNNSRMKKFLYIIIICALVTLTVGCNDGKSVRHVPHIGNTPYQQDSVLVAYATDPERAITLLDSALLLGNISDYRSQIIRAKIYSKSLTEQRHDSAIILCKSLLAHDSVRNNPTEQENIFDILIATSRAKNDDEAYLQWATKKAELCQQQGEETERWRTEADIGLLMTFLGQVDWGLLKLDEAIGRLDASGSIDRMDAFTVAVKRKINALNELGRYDEVIPLAQRTLDRLDHYEQHIQDYAEDSYRLSWSDNPSDRDRYLDFSRAQAWGFMAQAYAYTHMPQKAREYLALFDQSDYGRTFSARRLIAPTQIALGMYDEALATYTELERRMAADTLNDDYAIILRSRATVARAQGHIAEALDYQTRYANLSKVLSDSLHKSDTHDYAARYRLQEQQLEIQEKQAEAERSHIVSAAIAIIALLAIVFAFYFFHQKRIVSEKNRALVRMISGIPPESDDEPDAIEDNDEEANDEDSISEAASDNSSDADLFTTINSAIRSERLYSNVALQRQDICERFGIHRHKLNDLISTYAGASSFTQYINAIRMEEAVSLLRDRPDLTLTAVAAVVGFTPANLREKFKHQYGMTPGEFRQNM